MGDKNTKEVSRTLTEQQMKINTTNSNYEAINKRLDAEIKHTMETLKDTHKDDSLMGEMKALLVSKTYATREDLTRSLKTIPNPISKDEISKMIQASSAELSNKI